MARDATPISKQAGRRAADRAGAGTPPEEPVARRLGGVAAERARDDPPHGVPVALRSAQHVSVSRGRFETPWSRRVVMVKWVIEGEAAIAVAGQRLPFKPGDVAIYLPTIPYRFWAVNDVNEMCWFSVDGPLVEQFMLELELRPGVYPFGPAPVGRIAALMEGLKNHTVQGRRAASLLAIQMLYQLADSVRAPEFSSVVNQAQHIVQQEYSDPDLSTERIAERLGYHRGSLSRLFHRHAGVTLLDYMTEVRLQHAKSMLRHTDTKVAEVSRKCGFREPTYFSRWLQKHAGSGPRLIRKSKVL